MPRIPARSRPPHRAGRAARTCAVALALWVRPGELHGQDAPAVFPPPARPTAGWSAPAGLDHAVRDAVAALWGVAPVVVTLVWDTPARVRPGSLESTPALERRLPPGAFRTTALLSDQPATRQVLGPSTGYPVSVVGTSGASFFRILVPGDRGPHLLTLRAGGAWPVLLAAHALPRHTPVSAQNTIAGIRWVWGPPPGADATPAVGWRTRRPLQAGEPLLPPAVEPAPLVHTGDTVTVDVTTGPLTLGWRGVALSDGGLGDPVTVRVDAARRVRGRVTGPRRVAAETAAPPVPPVPPTPAPGPGGIHRGDTRPPRP